MSGAGGPQESYLRLQEEHTKALNVSRERTAKWEGFLRDYEALQARLYTLPDQLTHDVMVPFGKCAFMPGKLYHTNEVMVLLGDNWFAKRSAKQALELAGRRREYVMKKLEEERKQLQDWEARLTFTEDIRSSQQDHEGVLKEIQEEVGPEDSNFEYSNGKRVWRARKPTEGVPRPRPAFSVSTPQKTPGMLPPTARKPQEEEGGGATSGHTLTDEQLWARLEELERKEEEEEEGEEEREEREMRAQSGSGRSGNGTLQIRVRHSASTREPGIVEKGVSETASTEQPLFLTPGDISRSVPPPWASPTSEEEGGGAGSDEEEEEEEGRKKGVRWDPQLVRCKEEEEEEVPGRSERQRGMAAKAREERRPLAFSGQVVERVTPTDTMSATDSERPKKMSKFKASRRT